MLSKKVCPLPPLSMDNIPYFFGKGKGGGLRGELGENLFTCPPFLVALFAENQLSFQNRVYARQD